MTGEAVALEEISSTMAPAIPKCPHCQQPIRQHVSSRYNRLINRAVIDQMTKRFIVTGQADLESLQQKLENIDRALNESRSSLMQHVVRTEISKAHERGLEELRTRLNPRYTASAKLCASALQLQQSAAKSHQPAQKLHNATMNSQMRARSVEDVTAALSLDDKAAGQTLDQRITMGARILQVKINCLVLSDYLYILSDAKAKRGGIPTGATLMGKSPIAFAKSFSKPAPPPSLSAATVLCQS